MWSRRIGIGSRILSKRLFSSCCIAKSHIGSDPVAIPDNVKVSMIEMVFPQDRGVFKEKSIIRVMGPLGALNLPLADFIGVEYIEGGNKLSVSINQSGDKVQRQMWGTSRSLLFNNVIGVSEGHMSILKFVGTGYRVGVESKGKRIVCKAGFSMEKKIPVPKGLQCSSPQPTRLVIRGIDKQKVSAFAAKIRHLKPPEPYKGKGIFVDGETIKLKPKKVK